MDRGAMSFEAVVVGRVTDLLLCDESPCVPEEGQGRAEPPLVQELHVRTQWQEEGADGSEKGW